MQFGGCKDTYQNRAHSLLRRQARGRKANNNGIVSRQHQVDRDDLDECNRSFAGKKPVTVATSPERSRG